MKFWIFLSLWLIIRVGLHIFTAKKAKDENYGGGFYKGLFVSVVLDILFFFVTFYAYMKVRPLFSYLFSINIITFFYYGLDKYFAMRIWFRIPEKVLLTLSFLGGSIGALFGMYLFHHKTKKVSFQIWFWILIVIQIILVYLLYRYVLR